MSGPRVSVLLCFYAGTERPFDAPSSCPTVFFFSELPLDLNKPETLNPCELNKTKMNQCIKLRYRKVLSARIKPAYKAAMCFMPPRTDVISKAGATLLYIHC